VDAAGFDFQTRVACRRQGGRPVFTSPATIRAQMMLANTEDPQLNIRAAMIRIRVGVA